MIIVPLTDFSGNTFVAFLDISGFKELMKKRDGWKALDTLYSSGYRALRDNPRIEGIFVSDCGILFARNPNNLLESLDSLLKVIQKINIEMTKNEFMVQTSIAYGDFKHSNRIEFRGIEKNAIFGNAYLSAVVDNEISKPKLEPTQCRIVKTNFPEEINLESSNNTIMRKIKSRRGDRNHFYFYWMVDFPNQIEEFEKSFKDSYQMKYAGMLNSAKKFVSY